MLAQMLTLFKNSPAPPETVGSSMGITPVYDASLDLEASSWGGGGYGGFAPAAYSLFDGDKFPGGFGATELLELDYWTLRQRSSQLFTKNIYARGMIRRMVTNEIATGLALEAIPEGSLLDVDEDYLEQWSENVEKRYEIYGRGMCDYAGENSLGTLQRIIRRESLIEGDMLVVYKQTRRNGVPQLELISGNRVRTPLGAFGGNIYDGVELDEAGKQIAYHVVDDNGKSVRIPAYGPRSGRRVARLVYSTDKRHNQVRGEPVLSIVLQSLKEIDRYRDASLRKSVINSILAMFIAKTEDKAGTLPMTGSSTLKRSVQTDAQAPDRKLNIAGYGAPGIILDELQTGETPVAFKTETDVNFATFEEAIVSAMAWAMEIPPEILRLSFSSNYSASQAGINEYKLYLNPTRQYFTEQVNQPLYETWLLNEVLNGRIQAPGLIEAWRNNDGYTYGAWVFSDFTGATKPSTDMVKTAKAYEILVDRGWISNSRAARELTGTKFTRNVKRNGEDNELLVEMRRPLAEMAQEYSTKDNVSVDVDNDIDGE